MPSNPKANPPASKAASNITLLPAPKAINLHNLEAVRREMSRVYRDMRNGTIQTQDGARLVYVLGEVRKMFEVVDLEKRIAALEVIDNGPT